MLGSGVFKMRDYSLLARVLIASASGELRSTATRRAALNTAPVLLRDQTSLCNRRRPGGGYGALGGFTPTRATWRWPCALGATVARGAFDPAAVKTRLRNVRTSLLAGRYGDGRLR